MDKEQFTQHLTASVATVIPFTRSFVNERLPDDLRFLVHCNCSYDGNPRMGDEQVYPHEGVPRDTCPLPCTADEVIALLWRNGFIPEWINMTVADADARYTYLRLDCCGRFTAGSDLLYHIEEGYPPFHVLSPQLPPGRKDSDAKFSLRWRT